MSETNNIILFEYDEPIDLYAMINYEAGVWYWMISPGDVTVSDDQGEAGYYSWTNSVIYNVQSFRYEELYFVKVTSLADCRITDNSFFYDESTTKIYVHREDEEPILSDNMIIGIAVGYSFKSNDNDYYTNKYYEPRITSMFALKKSIDPLFYGLLKYQSGNINFINNDGEFDDWRSRNLFAMAARILIAPYGSTYSEFNQLYSGYIENDTRSWDDFSLTIQDKRKGLTQGVATNLLGTTEYPNLDPSNNDIAKPVAYGKILNAPTYCLNELESGSPTHYTFLYADTEFNPVASIQEVRVDGVTKSVASSDLAAGTFTLATADVGGEFGEVKVDFTVGITNGVDILKDLMYRYDGKPFLASFFDLDEVNAAETDCRDTSLYIEESSTKLSDAIESVANDCDIRFFLKDNGLYTARLYDADRTPTTTIYNDDWLDDPKVVNNGNQYLTSVRIGYSHDIEDDKRLYHENVAYKDSTFEIYKQYKTDTFDTELTTLADAVEKSETIMNISSNISDIIDRTVNWDFVAIEPTDFVIAAPANRISSTTVDWGIYEVMSVTKSLTNFTVKLSLRYVKDYVTEEINIYAFVRENDDYFYNESNDTLIRTMRNNHMTDENDIFFVDENDSNLIDETEVE